MGSKVVGIKDVARAAGVSTTTVSHALSGKGRLPEETRVRVRRIADELGYRPNAVARSLAEGRTAVLGTAFSVSLQDASHAERAWYAALLAAAADRAKRMGYALVHVPQAEGSEIWERLPIDGSVIVEPRSDDPHLAVLAERRLPWVAIGRPPGREGWFVDNDNEALVRQVFDHVRAGGATRTALVSVDWESSWLQESIASYRTWCRDRGLEPSVIVVPPALRLQALAELMQRPDRPDGIFCLFEGLALELVDAAHEHGVRIPEDLLVVAGGDVGLAERADPPVSTVDYNATGLGAAAVELLVDQLEGVADAGRSRFLPTRLTPRRSSAGLAR